MIKGTHPINSTRIDIITDMFADFDH